MTNKIAIVVLGAILLLTGTLHADVSSNPMDFNNDGRVNEEDFATFSAEWLWSVPPDPNHQWALIPSGEFEMGDHFSEGISDELPVHAVYVDSFYMSRYEVTNQQYCDYLNSAYPGQLKVVSGVVYASTDTGNSYPYCNTSTAFGYSQIDFSDPDFSVRTKPAGGGRDMSNDPMVEVSWYGAVAYCDYYGYRLPTEAEWEYAARGGENSPYYRFPWGDTINHDYANYRANGSAYFYDTSPYTTYTYHPDWDEGGYPYTSVVGSFSANGYGLYDMTGNVWEWCNDWYDGNYYDVSLYDNPQGPASSTYRVRRGGGWDYDASYCRVACRLYNYPGIRYHIIGFRIVLDF